MSLIDHQLSVNLMKHIFFRMNRMNNTPPKSSERYGALDGLRTYAAIGIVLMHVLYNIGMKPTENYLTGTLIPWFTDFTAHPTNPVECCADANPKTMLPNDT